MVDVVPVDPPLDEDEHDKGWKNYPILCLSHSRCRLCQFELSSGETAIVDRQDGSAPVEFAFCADGFLELDEYRVKVCMCFRCGDTEDTQSVTPYHAQCFLFNNGEPSPEYLAITEYSVKPTIAEQRRRKRRIVRLLTERIRSEYKWPKQLPTELWRSIASYLVSECAIIGYQLQTSDTRGSTCHPISFEDNIFARYIMIDGHQYIAKLRSSTQSEPEPGEKILLRATDASQIRHVFFAEDHLGVKLVSFSSLYDDFVRKKYAAEGLWWRHLSLPAKTSIYIRTDGLKVRGLSHSDKDIDSSAWSLLPSAATKILNLVDLEVLHKPPSGFRMNYFNCNSPDVTGYSVATTGMDLVHIHAHTNNESHRFYQEIDSVVTRNLHWIYMPLRSGEYVTELSRQLGFSPFFPNGDPTSAGLTFETNLGQVMSFGHYHSPYFNASNFTDHIYSPREDECRIFFNEWDGAGQRYIKCLGFEDLGPPKLNYFPETPVPRSRCPQHFQTAPYFFTFCDMDDVVTVTVCQNPAAEQGSVVGMLVTYANGHKACAGQYRFDWAQEPLILDRDEKLYIGFTYGFENRQYVSCIRKSANALDSSSNLLEVPLKGRLEWWFSSSDVRLSYCEPA